MHNYLTLSETVTLNQIQTSYSPNSDETVVLQWLLITMTTKFSDNYSETVGRCANTNYCERITKNSQ